MIADDVGELPVLTEDQIDALAADLRRKLAIVTARCTFCRSEIDVDDEDTMPVCDLCAVDPAITGDRDQVDATFVIDTIAASYGGSLE